MFDTGGSVFPSVDVAEIAAALVVAGRPELGEQMARVVIPLQMLKGSPEKFSFLAYPWPRLTYDQRMATELRDWDAVKVDFQEGSVEIHLDDFGVINWFYIDRVPIVFSKIKSLMGSP